MSTVSPNTPPLADNGDAFGPGNYQPQQLAQLRAEELQTTVKLMVQEWMIGQALPPMEGVDDAAFDSRLGAMGASSKLSVVHAIESRIGVTLSIGGSEVNIAALTEAVAAATRGLTQGQPEA